VKSQAQTAVLTPKKRPVQRRSQQTFDALVEATTNLLVERGFARTTTNHIAERAGVGIASLYEYFPGKEAIVAQVAERLVARVLARLGEGATRATDGDEVEAMRHWIEWIHDTLAREKKLIAVFLYQVPFTEELESIRNVREELLTFSRRVRLHSGGRIRADVGDTTLHLVVNLVTSTILQLLFDPPPDVSRRAMLDELARRLDEWIHDAARHGARPRVRRA
jgi:AcrR family transcriptional regulator